MDGRQCGRQMARHTDILVDRPTDTKKKVACHYHVMSSVSAESAGQDTCKNSNHWNDNEITAR
jgi:hypothetical protein